MRFWPFGAPSAPLPAPRKGRRRQINKLKDRVAALEGRCKRLSLDNADLWERVERALGRITGREKNKHKGVEPEPAIDVNKIIRNGGKVRARSR